MRKWDSTLFEELEPRRLWSAVAPYTGILSSRVMGPFEAGFGSVVSVRNFVAATAGPRVTAPRFNLNIMAAGAEGPGGVGDMQNDMPVVNVGGILANRPVVDATGISGPPAQISTEQMGLLSVLVISGGPAPNTMEISWGNGKFTVVCNGNVQRVDGPAGMFGELIVRAGDAGDTITVDASVTISALLYGGAGDDVLSNQGSGYAAVVTVGGGVDTVTAGGNVWGDTGDVLPDGANAVAGWYQNVTSDPTDPNYVPLELKGQNLPDPVDTYDPVHYRASLWGTGPIRRDVSQYLVPDCYLLATLDAMAVTNPTKLEQSAVELGDGTFAVKFERGGIVSYVRVDGDFGHYQCKPLDTGDVWTLVIEKAYAEYRYGNNSFYSLGGGWMDELFKVMGWSPTVLSPQSEQDLMTFFDTSPGVSLTFGTGDFIWNDAHMTPDHGYVILGYTAMPDGSVTFQIGDPWGYDGGFWESNPWDAIVTVSWEDIRINSLGFCAAE